ncbi:MAG TPA: type II toxin-antitoxin system Phd/YefM family antitoxin [Thermoanaerobaculia bacterium]|jgi:prevent-host-death family protein|nr:type II toxin-antitoxin system Phd/YefM family antitoxin [Thermoanaerobaculia bacterium]
MKTVNVHEAKTHLSKLLKRVEKGEEIVIANAGKPVAKLVQISGLPQKRTFGSEAGRFHVPEDFNDPLPDDILDDFYR